MTEEEVRRQLVKLKKGTAAGKDGIPNETWPKTLTMLSAKLKRGVD